MFIAMLLIAARACDSFISLHGVVLNTDRQPVQGALVTLTWKGRSTSTLSDSAGHFNVHMPIPWFFDSDSSHLDACKPGVGYGGRSFPLNYSSKVELTVAPAGPHSSHGECHESASGGSAPLTSHVESDTNTSMPRRQQTTDAMKDSEIVTRVGFAATDTGCFRVSIAGPMNARDSDFLNRVGVLRVDTAQFSPAYPGWRMIRGGAGLGPGYTFNIWVADSLTDSVRWQVGHAVGGIAFALARRPDMFVGEAFEYGDGEPHVRRMGKAAAKRVSCAASR